MGIVSELGLVYIFRAATDRTGRAGPMVSIYNKYNTYNNFIQYTQWRGIIHANAVHYGTIYRSAVSCRVKLATGPDPTRRNNGR